MSHDYNNPAFKKLLQKLQEESWQLELLISGFAIFGLFTAYPEIDQTVKESQNSQQIYSFVIALVAQISCAILIFNLLLHVLLRGLWIGALGLRYVSGDIDYESLNYSPKFTRYLKKRVGSFDKYIASLENYCSVIFAISFLLIFYVLALTFTILAIALIANYLIGSDTLPEWLSKGVGIVLILFLIFGMFLTLIDFITLGFLKKKKWISRLYFPIYWVFSFVTLSFLYRPLVYNFLDNKFGRRLSLILVPFYIVIFLLTSLQYETSNYFDANDSSSEIIANNENYENLLVDSKVVANEITIQSKVITEPFIKVFIPFSERIENRIYHYNPGLEPETDNRGLVSNITFNNTFSFGTKRDSLRNEYIKTFNTIYSVKIDTTVIPSSFILAKNVKNKLGFETYLSSQDLEEGQHIIRVRRLRIIDADTSHFTEARIPFWYYNNN